jgi:NosR/NirI family transcriptional regulator, nitrous oxide reductase regulator
MSPAAQKYLLKIPVIILFLAVFFLAKEEPAEKFDFGSNDVLSLVQEYFPDAAGIEQVNYLSKWSNIYGPEGAGIGKFLLTSPYCDNIKGYGGSLSAVIISKNDEKVIGVKLVSHRETPAWISGLENIKFFGSWNGRTINELTGPVVDAVSGATYTSRAMSDIVKKRAGIFLGQVLYEKKGSKFDLKWIENKVSPVLYFILLISIIALFVKKLNRFRIYIQILSIIFFGLISGKFISIYLLESISVQGISVIISYTTAFLLTFSVLVPLFLNKHFYCFYICPFGGVQTLLGKIPVKKINFGSGTIRTLRAIRMLIFVSILAAVSSSLKIDMSLVEPFTIFIFSSAAAVTVISSAIIFAASIFIRNPWCVYLCPTGVFFDLLKDGIKKT